MNNKPLLRIFFAMTLAFFAGLLSRENASVIAFYDFVGTLFLQGLKLVVVPLVVASVISGTARLAQSDSVQLLGGRTIAYFLLTSSLAIICGLAVAHLFAPYFSAFPLEKSDGAAAIIASQAPADIGNVFKELAFQLIPSNIFAAATKGQMVGLIFFSILFGWFITKVEQAHKAVLYSFWDGTFQVIMHITKLFMLTMPFGIFALIAKVVATTGVASLKPLMLFSATVLTALLLYGAALLPCLLHLLGRVNSKKFFKDMTPALLTAFSTSSTAATIPVTMKCLEKSGSVPSSITNFVVPLASSVNLAGTALYQAIAVVFIAACYGVQLPFASLGLVGIMSLVTSFGMAGIPSACLVSIVVILQALGLPAEGVSFIIAVERLLDMARTPVSVWTNSSCAALVAAAEKREAVQVVENGSY